MAKTQKAALTTKFLNSAAAHARVFQLISHTNPLKCFPIVFAPKFASQVDHLKHIRSDVRISSCISLFPGFFIFIFLPTQLLFGRRLGVDATTFHTNPLKCFPIVFAPKFASQVDHLKHIRSDVRISSCISLFPGFFIFIFLPTQLLFGRRLGVDATTFAKRARDLAPGDHNESRDAFASPSDSPRARRTRTGERRRGSARRTPAFGRPRARAIASRPRGFPLPRGDGRGAFRVVIVGSGH